MVNVHNVDRVIAAIRGEFREDVGFNMNFWTDNIDNVEEDHSGRNCGTVACIGGWCNIIENTDKGWDAFGDDDGLRAADFLGLDYPTAHQLFYPVERSEDGTSWTIYDYEKITVEHAVEVLELLKETGKVCWDEVLGPAAQFNK